MYTNHAADHVAQAEFAIRSNKTWWTWARPIGRAVASIIADQYITSIYRTISTGVPRWTVTLTGAIARATVTTRVGVDLTVGLRAGRSNESRRTRATIPGHFIHTRGTVLARIATTLVDVDFAIHTWISVKIVVDLSPLKDPLIWRRDTNKY
jgi:hypothetical protein